MVVFCFICSAVVLPVLFGVWCAITPPMGASLIVVRFVPTDNNGCWVDDMISLLFCINTTLMRL